MAGPRPVLVVAGRHRPHELMLLLFSLLIGLAYTLGSPPPQSLAAVMPRWNVRLWAVGLLVSGAAGLAGSMLPLRLYRGLLVELGAMLIGAGALIVATAAIIQYTGPARGAFGGGFCAAWALANLWRGAQILRDLREVP